MLCLFGGGGAEYYGFPETKIFFFSESLIFALSNEV